MIPNRAFSNRMKVLTTLSYLCLFMSLIMAAVTSKPSAYELSLYDNYAPLFWVLTIVASLSGVTILLLSARNKIEHIWSTLAILVIILVNVLLVSLPLFLGYAANNRADVLNHIGYVRDIQITGKLSPLDFYPGLHILQYATQVATGLNPGQSIILVNIAFTILWTISPMLLVEQLAKDKRASYIAAAFTAPFWLIYYQDYILPSVLSLFLLPILIALHFRRTSEVGSRAALFVVTEIIIALFLVYLHPTTTLFLIVIFLCFEFSTRFRNIKKLTKSNYQYFGMILIMTVVFLTWYLSFSSFTEPLSKLIYWLLGERDRSSAMGEIVGLLSVSHLPVPELLKILLNAFLTPVIIIGLTYILIITLLFVCRKRQIRIPDPYYSFIVAFIVLTLLTIGLFFISSAERQPIRILRTLVILSVCITSWWLWEVVYNSRGSSIWIYMPTRKRQIIIGGIFLILLVGIILSRYNLYENPRNGLPNQRVTISEMYGMKWFSTHREESTQTAAILPDYVSRFDAYFWGLQGIRNIWPQWWEPGIWLPSGFYEPTWLCIGEIRPGVKTYLILSENGKIAPLRYPEEVREYAHIYTNEDWNRLDQDFTISKIYDNGAFEVWMTNSDPTICK